MRRARLLFSLGAGSRLTPPATLPTNTWPGSLACSSAFIGGAYKLVLRIGHAGGVTEPEPATNVAEHDQGGIARDLSAPILGRALSGVSRPGRRSVGSASRRTRVVATIGPASDDPATLSAMQDDGMDVARLPLAHGSLEDAVERLRRVRQAAPDVGVLVDLPGPKIRTTPFPEGGVTLVTGQPGRAEPASISRLSSNVDTIGVSVPELVESLQEGDRIALGDGGVSLIAEKRQGHSMKTRVIAGGKVQGRPGRNSPGIQAFADDTYT